MVPTSPKPVLAMKPVLSSRAHSPVTGAHPPVTGVHPPVTGVHPSMTPVHPTVGQPVNQTSPQHPMLAQLHPDQGKTKLVLFVRMCHLTCYLTRNSVKNNSSS